MGFLFFTQSCMFNPKNYGLKVGDVIRVVAVGGGGGTGGIAYASTPTSTSSAHTKLTGGAGAPSSFGDYVTANGGTGGTGYLNSGGNINGMSIPNGGWLPYCESHPMIRNESPKLYADIQQEYISVGRVKIIDSLKGFLIGQSGGTLINLPQYIYSNNVGSGVITRDYISTITIENMVPWISYSTGFITTRNTSSGKTGNSGCYLQNRIIDSSIPAAKNGTCWVNAAQISIIGSIGYGVGGSSFGFSRNYDTNIEWGGFSGNTGDIVKTTIVLQDTAPIAVSVGCGDGSAGYVSNKSTGLNGNNGTSSAGGASNGQSSSASGFCNGVSSDYISGGGVNGCVAIWF